MSSQALFERAAAALRVVFGREPEDGLAVQAPGRVNLIGEHTDYNGGLVLPFAIDRGTVAVAARRDDALLRVHSTSLGATGAIDTGAFARGRGWLDYVGGVVAAFRSEGLPVPGLDVALASDLPRESGLSSSASLEVAIATLLDVAGSIGLDGAARARLAHRAESEFVGVPCGRMDQLASALGQRACALRIDCRDFSVRAVPLPGERMRVLIVDSGVRRQLADGDYGRRRAECEAGLAAARGAGIAPLARIDLARRRPGAPRGTGARARAAVVPPRAPRAHRERARGRGVRRARRRRSGARRRAAARRPRESARRLRSEPRGTRRALRTRRRHARLSRLAPHRSGLRRLHDPSRRSVARG